MKKGFTLIELLVVVSIVIILSAIIFPVFAQAKERANQITCASNLRQLALAFQEYAGDYNGRFPVLQPLSTMNGGETWATRLLPYVGSESIFKCPDDIRTPDTTYAQYPHGKTLLSYGYNSWLAGAKDPWSGYGPKPPDYGVQCSAVLNPECVILIFDAVTPAPNNTLAYPDDYPAFMPGLLTQPCRHKGRGISVPPVDGGDNYAFVDGHVKWFLIHSDYEDGQGYDYVNGTYDVYTDSQDKISFDYTYSP